MKLEDVAAALKRIYPDSRRIVLTVDMSETTIEVTYPVLSDKMFHDAMRGLTPDCVIYTLANWQSACASGARKNDEGTGYYAIEDAYCPSIPVYPSEHKTMKPPKWVTHIAWINKS